MTKLTRRRALAVAGALALGAIVATLFLVGAHQQREAMRRLDAANAAFVQHAWGAAADNAHAAALRAWPRSNVQSEAFDVLEHTARAAQAAGNTPAALVAWTDMHHAAVATRSIVSDTTAWERQANDGVRATGGGVVTEARPVAGGGRPSDALRLLVALAVVLGAGALVWLTRARAARG